MEQVFNGSRYLRLILTETRTFRKQYLFFAAAVVLIALLAQRVGSNSFESITSIIILIAPFILYKNLYHSVKGVSYTMLPASNFEKWLACWTQCVVILPLILLIVWAILRILTGLLHPSEFTEFINIKASFSSYWDTIAGQSLTITAVMMFRRQKWQKLIGVLFVMAFIGTILGISWMGAMNQMNAGFTPTDWSTAPWIVRYAEVVISLIFPFGLWLVSFFKLEEQEL